ncbi:MAG: hypothetical protein A4E48_00876 [Methanosaeta sp. PtaU1.Bin060]|nr:MAG: hypothetical protein A4E48_00876 [Methanosaeta sp. PtaU1.Bin060]
MRILSIVGARPQFIKAFALSSELRKKHVEILVHTGQHYDYEMSRIFFEELSIPEPDYNLGVGSSTHGAQTGRIMERVEEVIVRECPDLVLVYGDTNSTLAGALVAAKLHIKVGHVEAGLRSYDRRMPEEINRVVTDHISDLLFAPTETAMGNMKKEGITKGTYLVGDVMCDALKIAKQKTNRPEIMADTGEKYLVATIHRAENTDDMQRLSRIIRALRDSNRSIILPLHPRTKRKMGSNELIESINGNLKIINPVGYLSMISLMTGAEKILTDSGGVQKEAYILGKPCITMRETTEWIETVNAGWNVLVGSNRGKILNAINDFNPKGDRADIFGDGRACESIGEVICEQMKLFP